MTTSQEIKNVEAFENCIDLLRKKEGYQDIRMEKSNRGYIIGRGDLLTTSAYVVLAVAKTFFGEPLCVENGEIKNGYIQLCGDQDFHESKVLAEDILDAYNACVTQLGLERLGYTVYVNWEGDVLSMEVYLQNQQSVCSY